MYFMYQFQTFTTLLRRNPSAIAMIQGSSKYPKIQGEVQFYPSKHGVMVISQTFGLPAPSHPCSNPVFGFHIHSGQSCTGTAEDPFQNALKHYNPKDCPHPHHTGDMPPLFGNNGYAFSAFVSNRFTIRELIGKTVIIHSQPDDFVTQPSGNAGEKMACGIIRKTADAYQ